MITDFDNITYMSGCIGQHVGIRGDMLVLVPEAHRAEANRGIPNQDQCAGRTIHSPPIVPEVGPSLLGLCSWNWRGTAASSHGKLETCEV